MRPPSSSLIERERELHALDATLEEAIAGRGGVVLLEGPAGVGKSALLRELAARGREAGALVLTAIGAELEREYPYGALRQMLEAEVFSGDPERSRRLLSGASALAAPVLGGAPMELDAGQDRSFAALHGCYWLVAGLSEEQPLMLVFDDAQWSDAASLRFVEFLARRVGELPVLVAIGVRSGEPGAETGLLDAIADGDETIMLRPRPLSSDGAAALVTTGLGERATPEITQAAFGATQGNPLLLSELTRTLAETDGRLTHETVEAVVPSSVSRSVQRRLARLSGEAQRVARALATLGERTSDELLGTATGLTPTMIATALEDLRGNDLVARDGTAFAHPLVRQAVADGVPVAERHRLHASVAAALHARGGREEVIVHLLAGPPLHAEWAYQALREGARRSLAEGAPEAAAHRLTRALEEAGGATDPELQLELGVALLRAGDPTGVTRLAVASEAGDPVVFARATMSIVQAESLSEEFDGKAVSTRLRDALDRLGSHGPIELRDALMGALISASSLSQALLGERRELRTREADHDLPVLMRLRAFDGACADMPTPAVIDLAQASIAAAPFDRLAEVESAHAWWPIGALYLVDAGELADRALATAEATARQHGSRLGRAWVQTNRGYYTMHAGSVTVAEASAREAIELWQAIGFARVAMTAVGQLAGALVLRNELAEAEQQLALCAAEDAPFSRATMLCSRAMLRLAQHRPREAVADLRAVQEVADALGQRRFGWGHAGLQLASALIAAGQLDEAAAIGQEELAVADRAGRVSLRVGALTVLGLAGDPVERISALREAAGARVPSCAPIVAAQAKLAYGAALRRGGHPSDARDWLRDSHEIASRVDCRRIADQALQELVIAGGRPRSRFSTGLDALTPSERRVAEHAAAGLSNREIAETLFVTRKTVELHLGHAYGKLGIRSRAQLPAALGPADDSADAELG